MELLSFLFLAALWLVLFWLLGVPTLAKRRYVLFVLGIPIPLFWAFGAILPGRY